MPHWLQGIVGRPAIRAAAKSVMPEALYSDLKQVVGIAFEPVYDTDLRAEEFGRFQIILAPLSAEFPCAYVATNYHGGTGNQAAATWMDGRCVLPFTCSDIGSPISEALRQIGVEKVAGETDEFASVGLSWCRNNEIMAAVLSGYERDYYGMLESLPQSSESNLN